LFILDEWQQDVVYEELITVGFQVRYILANKLSKGKL
jgi:hypothetical protein